MVKKARAAGLGPGSLGQAGQTTTEYILLLAIVAGVAFQIIAGLKQMKLTAVFTKPLTTDFKAAYRYGHPKAKGPEDGGSYEHHPVAVSNESRIFFNPGRQ